MCGICTTLVEAAHLGRDAIGVEREPRWAQLARDNLTHPPSRESRARSSPATPTISLACSTPALNGQARC